MTRNWRLTRRGFLGLTALGTAAARPGALGFRPLPSGSPRPARAAEPNDGTACRFDIADFNRITVPALGHQSVVSPDGRLLAWAAVRIGDAYFHPGVGEPELETGAPGRWVTGVRLVVTDVWDGTSTPLPGPGRAWSPRWSPDGRRLAFLADHAGAVNVWTWERRGRPRRLSDAVVYGDLFGNDTPQWSPDGARLYVPLRPRAAGSGPRPPAGDGFHTPAVDVLRGPTAPPGGTVPGLRELGGPYRFRDLGMIDTASGRFRRLLRDFPASRYFLAPDGNRLAVLTLAVEPDVAVADPRQDLYLMEASGAPPTLLARRLQGYTSTAAWSPDSTRLAFVQEGRVVVVDAGTGRRDELAADDPFSTEPYRPAPTPLLWHPDGRRLLAQATDGRLWCLTPGAPGGPAAVPLQARHRAQAVHRAGTGMFVVVTGDRGLVFERRVDGDVARGTVSSVPLDGAAPTVLLEEPGTLSFARYGDVSADGTTVVFGAEDDDHPVELWTATVEGTATPSRRRLTRLNPHLERRRLSRARLVPFESPRGRLGSRFLPPPTGTPPFPTVVSVYPSEADASGKFGLWDALDRGIVHAHVLAGRGFAVLVPDWPTEPPANRQRVEDTAEVVDPAIDAAVAAGYVDPTRLAVMGQSNGGAGVNLLVTTTTRFRAAVAANGISDWVSFFGQLRITADGTPLAFWTARSDGEPPWAGDERAAGSAVRRLDKVETPLLLVHGVEDSVVGFEQAGEMFVGLSYLGKDVTLLAYRGESHVPSRFREANRVHMTEHVLAFLEQHLGQAGGSPG